MKGLYRFHPQLILRTPGHPFTLAASEDHLHAVMRLPAFEEALYLASPMLRAEYAKWQQGGLPTAHQEHRLLATLTRYYSRFMSRCTPFGLFAGCSVLNWGAQSQVELRLGDGVRRTRLDMQYVCALAQHAASRPDVREQLRYWPNSSLYRLGAEYRYVERQHELGASNHQVSALAVSEILEQVLVFAQQGATLAELAAHIAGEEDEADDGRSFLLNLIEAQVLVSELEPTVTGPEFFAHVQAVVRRLASETPSLAPLLETLTQVQQALVSLSQPGPKALAGYEHVSALLEPLGVPTVAGQLFQTDVMHGVTLGKDTLNQACQATLQQALEALSFLTPQASNEQLADFIHRFTDRYEGQEVPLLQALDPESGVAYSEYGKTPYSALLHGLVLPPREAPRQVPPETGAERFLRGKLHGALATQAYSVAITLEELRDAGLTSGLAELSPSLGMLFRFIDNECLLVESIGGPSAVNLLGRFAHTSPAIHNIIQELTQQEQAHNPGVTFAEICHLPASRVGNLV